MDKENQINELMSSAIEKIKSVVDTNTVVGVPFETKDGMLIIPLTKVSVGFVAGGGEYSKDKKSVKELEKYPFAGGSGAGLSMNPIGLLKIKGDKVDLIRVDEKSTCEQVFDAISSIVSDIAPMFSKGDK